ncbi:MAG: hypothetical protein C0631_03200 [Sedimenticola sp.]|jgi:hypothetical protein|nr:MAG: hypothetical protein C0631_03200 [Sedimenticola sp.]
MGQDNSPNQSIPWSDLSISSLEADIAYFDARLALLRETPSSYYQEAQIRAYKELENVLGEHLRRLRHARGMTWKKAKS